MTSKNSQIDDSGRGIKAAQAAKIKAVGKLTEFNSKKDLKQANLIINNLNEL